MVKLSTNVTSSPPISGSIPSTGPFAVWIEGSNVPTTRVIATPNIVSLRLASRSADR
jgi:hypothetical protein